MIFLIREWLLKPTIVIRTHSGGTTLTAGRTFPSLEPHPQSSFHYGWSWRPPATLFETHQSLPDLFMGSNTKSCSQQQAHNCVCPKQQKAAEAVPPEIIRYLSKIIWVFIVNFFSCVKNFSAIPVLGKIRK